jgi:hypothetical protein
MTGNQKTDPKVTEMVELADKDTEKAVLYPRR